MLSVKGLHFSRNSTVGNYMYPQSRDLRNAHNAKEKTFMPLGVTDLLSRYKMANTYSNSFS